MMSQNACPISSYNHPSICRNLAVDAYSFMIALMQEVSYHTENKGTRKHPDYVEVRDVSPSNAEARTILDCAARHLADIARELTNYTASNTDYHIQDYSLPYNQGTLRWGIAGVSAEGFDKVSRELHSISQQCDQDLALKKLYILLGSAGAAWFIGAIAYTAYHKIKHNESVIKNFALAIIFLPIMILALVTAPLFRLVAPNACVNITALANCVSEKLSDCTDTVLASAKSCGGAVSTSVASCGDTVAAIAKNCCSLWKRAESTTAEATASYGAADTTVTLV